MITGGGKGIGAATAFAFAREGAYVEIGDIDVPSSQKTVKDIEQREQSVYFTEVDVTDRASVSRRISDVLSRHAQIDLLFKNVGISAIGKLHAVDQAPWDHVIAVNFKGIYLVNKAVLPRC